MNGSPSFQRRILNCFIGGEPVVPVGAVGEDVAHDGIAGDAKAIFDDVELDALPDEAAPLVVFGVAGMGLASGSKLLCFHQRGGPDWLGTCGGA